MVNQKTTAVRVIPAVGKKVGDTVEFGGLLGYGPVMPVNRFSCADMINRGGEKIFSLAVEDVIMKFNG